ncbi:MAG: DNA repair protein RecN, partial [Candidatus Dormiibacterota bacterium]
GRERVAVLHEAWVRAAARHRALADARARGAEQRDFDLWRLRQLQSVDPQPGEDERLAVERSVLRHATQLLALVGLAGERLDTDGVAEAASAIAQAAQLDDRLGALAGRLGAVVEELRDGARELRGYGEALDADPGRLEEVESRLAALDEVKRRHGGTLDAVLAERDRLLAVLGRDGDPDEELAAATANELGAADELSIAASELTRARTAGADRFAAGVGTELAGLGLADARLEVRLVPREEIGVDGAETVEVWFTANAGEAPAPLQRVASGGELSRVMLAIEAATAEVSGTPTLVFDEVDAGIGGATALEVGRRLQRLARHRQVLVVTHLAQVAAFADRHLVVDKIQAAGRTAVRVTDLRTAAERGPELARMMSGAVTEKALARAEELLDSARPPEPLAGPARSTARSVRGGAHAASTRPRHRPPARQPVRTPA